MSLDAINILKGLAYSQLEVQFFSHSLKMKESGSHNQATSMNKKSFDRLIEEKQIEYSHRILSTFLACIV